jgi:hypothetical protein
MDTYDEEARAKSPGNGMEELEANRGWRGFPGARGSEEASSLVSKECEEVSSPLFSKECEESSSTPFSNEYEEGSSPPFSNECDDVSSPLFSNECDDVSSTPFSKEYEEGSSTPFPEKGSAEGARDSRGGKGTWHRGQEGHDTSMHVGAHVSQ